MNETLLNFNMLGSNVTYRICFEFESTLVVTLNDCWFVNLKINFLNQWPQAKTSLRGKREALYYALVVERNTKASFLLL